MFLSPFYRWGSWGPEKAHNLSKTKSLTNKRGYSFHCSWVCQNQSFDGGEQDTNWKAPRDDPLQASLPWFLSLTALSARHEIQQYGDSCPQPFPLSWELRSLCQHGEEDLNFGYGLGKKERGQQRLRRPAHRRGQASAELAIKGRHSLGRQLHISGGLLLQANTAFPH